MSSMITTDKTTIVFGLGLTGLSVVRHLSKRGGQFIVVDSRDNPPGLEELETRYKGIRVYCNADKNLVQNLLNSAHEIVLSPGVPRSLPEIKQAIKLGVSVVGDIALFLREATAPVVGITGSNGKTTVTTIVGEVAKKAGINVAVAGNIGVPALDVLGKDCELYVLELSSFQLESIPKAGLKVACMLNVSEDHMDRYESLAAYCMAKQRIYYGAQSVVYNLDDKLTQPPILGNVIRYGFGLVEHKEASETKYLFSAEDRALSIEDKKIVSADELRMVGQHNIANALAVMAICDAVDIDRAVTIKVLSHFAGLAHRCEWIAEKGGVTFINDSKATNVGAAMAAIEGLAGSFRSMVLIAGGDGKGAEFSTLGDLISEKVDTVILLGQDAYKISQTITPRPKVVFVENMAEAVAEAFKYSVSGGVVLLSPACASFDMFNSFEERGLVFSAAVEALVA